MIERPYLAKESVVSRDWQSRTAAILFSILTQAKVDSNASVWYIRNTNSRLCRLRGNCSFDQDNKAANIILCVKGPDKGKLLVSGTNFTSGIIEWQRDQMSDSLKLPLNHGFLGLMLPDAPFPLCTKTLNTQRFWWRTLRASTSVLYEAVTLVKYLWRSN